MTSRLGGVRATALAATSIVALMLPSAVAAHAALNIATPAEGATLDRPPAEVSGTFTQDLVVDGSSMQLRDAGGVVIARGGVVSGEKRKMAIEDLPELGPGEYEVRWTTLSAEDDELDRGTWSFTVLPAPSASPSASPAASATPSATPTASPSVAPTPAASPAPGSDAGSGSDVILPIIAALAIVTIGAGFLLSRGRRGPSA